MSKSNQLLSQRLGVAVLGICAAFVLWPVAQWAVLDAVWSGSAEACAAASGACWAFIRLRLQFLLFGFYPPEQFYRAIAVILIAVGVVLLITHVRFVREKLARVYVAIFLAFVISVCLLRGDGLVLANVPSRLWTGFTLTVTVAFGGVALGLALGTLLAFGRNYGGSLLSTTCMVVIETLRALPSVVTMFIVIVVSPYVLPAWVGESMFFRIMLGFVLVAAAFYAEALRGALLTFAKGQGEAAISLGMKSPTVYLEVILPQVVALSFPALMNISLMVFKDTVLILAFGYYELLGAANASINTQEWNGFAPEMFIFVYAVFWSSCSLISRAGRAVERNLYVRKV